MSAAAAAHRSDDTNAPYEADSSYPELTRPFFQSAVPQHLLAEASPADCYVMNELSKLSQAMAWSVEAHLAGNYQTRKTDERLIVVEDRVQKEQNFRKSVLGGWRFVVGAGAACAGVVAFLIHVIKFLNGQ